MKNRPHYALSSVDHALQLATVLQVEGSISVAEAAERLGVARSTAHRLLAMLVYRDFAVQDADRRYSPGPVLSLAAHSRSRTSMLRSRAMPHLERLVNEVGETANLLILAGDHARIIGSVESRQALRVSNREGMVFPAHLTAGGRLMLADLADADLEAIYAEERWAERTQQRPDLADLRADLATVRHTGFAINAERTESGVTVVGRGVRVDGRVGAAVCTAMPTARFSEDRLPRLLAALTAAADHLERDMRHTVG
jgi:DNA-binding IclR family transcriptional regulator